VGSLEPSQLENLPRPERAVSIFKPWTEAQRDSTHPPAPTSCSHGEGLDVARSLLTPQGTAEAPASQAPTSAEKAEATAGEAEHGGASMLHEAPPPGAELLGDEALYWQLHNSYVFIQIKSGMVIVDQHAAHERVLYDRAVAAMEGRLPSLQRLLFPIPLELSVRQYAAYEESRELFEKLGFQLRPFGGRSVLVEEIPGEMAHWDEGAVLLGILDDLAENRERDRLPVRDRVLASYACRAAIMQGKRLSVQEMRALMDQLFATPRPYTCPHGRPTLLRIGLEDLDRRFGRT
jgi:DNA mismatch repair protein MutL